MQFADEDDPDEDAYVRMRIAQLVGGGVVLLPPFPDFPTLIQSKLALPALLLLLLLLLLFLSH